MSCPIEQKLDHQLDLFSPLWGVDIRTLPFIYAFVTNWVMFRFKKWPLWIGLTHYIIGLSQWVGDVFKVRGQTWLPIAPHLRPTGLEMASIMGFIIALKGPFFLRLLLAHKVLLWIIIALKKANETCSNGYILDDCHWKSLSSVSCFMNNHFSNWNATTLLEKFLH
jgi:hypothetical protein